MYIKIISDSFPLSGSQKLPLISFYIWLLQTFFIWNQHTPDYFYSHSLNLNPFSENEMVTFIVLHGYREKPINILLQNKILSLLYYKILSASVLPPLFLLFNPSQFYFYYKQPTSFNFNYRPYFLKLSSFILLSFRLQIHWLKLKGSRVLSGEESMPCFILYFYCF